MDSARIYSLACYLLPGRAGQCSPEYESHYNAAYQFWKETLIGGYLSEGLEDKARHLVSDDFMRQEEFVALFCGKQPVGLFMFDWINLHYPACLDHSYFKNYPPIVIEHLKQQTHSLIMTMSHLTVHPDWRKSEIGAGVSEILVGLATKRFLECSASLLLTFTRNNRKTNELGYRYGAIPLVKEYESHGISSDALAFYRENIRPSPIEGIESATDRLWEIKISGISNPILSMIQEFSHRKNKRQDVALKAFQETRYNEDD